MFYISSTLDIFSKLPKPIHVTASRLAAVVSPLTLNPSLSIVPAPIKPIPDKIMINICYWIMV